MEVVFTITALKQIKTLPKADAARLNAVMEEVAAHHPQRMSYVTEMVGRPNYGRARKGDYRAVFVIEGETITVTDIGHRKDIYQ